MDATELMVRGIVVGLFQENCYIIGSRTTGEAICVDPGDEVEEIRALARDMGVRITKIACSHAHLDHIMAVSPLKESTGATFLLHRADLDLARQLPDSAIAAGSRRAAPTRPGRLPPGRRRRRDPRHLAPDHSHARPHPGQHLPVRGRDALQRRHPLS